MHVDEQRPAAHDLDQLAGCGSRATPAAAAAEATPSSSTLPKRSGAPATAMRQADYGGAGHESSGRNRCRLDDRDHGVTRRARDRAGGRIGAHHDWHLGEHRQRICLAGVIRRSACGCSTLKRTGRRSA
jgi:hypothetical protein